MRRRVGICIVVLVLLGFCPAIAMGSPTPAALQLPLKLQNLLRTAEPTEEQVYGLFSPSIPRAELSTSLGILHETAKSPITLSNPHFDGEVVVAEVAASRGFIIDLGINPSESGKLIEGFWLQPRSPHVSSASQLDAVVRALGADRYNVVVNRVSNGKCSATFQDGNRSLGLGSMVKLFVLSALEKAVSAGTIRWQEKLTLRPDNWVGGSGDLQGYADGYQLTILDAAQKMIAISDNRATEMLMQRLGKPAIEAEFESVGDFANRPLPTLREVFQLTTTEPDLQREWDANPSVASRSDVLRQLRSRSYGPTTASKLDTPSWWSHHLEWFATPSQLCKIHVKLQQNAVGIAAPIKAILTSNTGLPVVTADRYVGFKGGETPGTLGLSWYVITHRGETKQITIQLQARTAEIFALEASYLAGAVTSLLSQ